MFSFAYNWRFQFISSAGTRTFVHEKIFDAFVAEATKLARDRKVGNPFDASVHQGLYGNIEIQTKISVQIIAARIRESVH